jgi:acetolactate synthase-1/2/3 large subunit
MKLSDYVAGFLAKQGIRHVFAIAGGASLHLMHSLAKMPGTSYICPQHEQAGAMAADAYSRVTGNIGAAVATSGPGATNMITGACCAYYDSVPVIYITGQVSTFRLKRDSGVRQMGFQETDVVDMYKPITKYAVMVENPQRIRYELEKAVHIAKSGRPGPVLLDIPDDVQRKDIDPDRLEGFTAAAQTKVPAPSNEQIGQCLDLIAVAKRPVLILGWGVRLAKSEKETRAMVESLGFPVALTWAMLDMLPSDHPLLIGSFGSHGTRYGNFAVQNADLIIAVGARLDTRETGGYTTFARQARKVVVDVDRKELDKFQPFGMKPDVLVHSDARSFVTSLNSRLPGVPKPDLQDWKQRISKWKADYPICTAAYLKEEDVNPYAFVKALSRASSKSDTIFVDTGCAVAWMSQAFEFKEGQRFFHDFNNTAMGYALPAAIGASLALGNAPVTCVTGDGSLQMNIQELATVKRHQLPVRIFLINNKGYSMIQQTQEQWLDSRYEGSTVEGGLAFPDFVRVAEAYGYKTFNITKNAALDSVIKEVFATGGPVFCNVDIRPGHRVIPQVKYGRALEDGEPLLERKEFMRNMIVTPDKASLE